MKKFDFSSIEEYAEHVLETSNEVLDKCEIYGDAEERTGLLTNIKKSIVAKSWLMEIFKNSPYHNGKGQLILPMEIERPTDEDVIQEYSYYIKDIARRYLLPEAKINGLTYSETVRKRDEIDRFIRAINYMNLSDDDVVIKGIPFSEYRTEYYDLEDTIDKFRWNENEYFNTSHLCDGYYTERINKEKYDKALIISDAIYHCVGHLLEDEDDIQKLAEAFPRSQCRSGIKISKVVQKCLKEIGLYDLAMENERETFNRRYAKWTDAVSPMKIKKWSVLSINFVDFLTMSHGDTWTSCLNTDKHRYFTGGMYSDGFNSRRVLDYALDNSTMVFYTVDENYEGDYFELQPKSTRQLFHFGERKLVQARLYPQANTSRRSIYDQYRANVEHLLANAMGEANLWSAPVRGSIEYDGNVVNIPYERSIYNGEYIDFLNIACHGGSETDFQDEVNYVVLKGSSNLEDNKIPMVIGSTNAVCIMCGKELSEGYHDAIACSSCY